MSWNKVVIAVETSPGHKTPLHFVIDAEIKVGTDVMCHTSKGVLPGSVRRVVTYDVKHGEYHKRVDVAKKQTNQPKIKEETTMVNEVFVTVFVENKRGYKNKCLSLIMFKPGDEVVYEGQDGELHVGKVVDSYAPGINYETHSKNYSNGGFVAHAVNRDHIAECTARQQLYNHTLEQLKARKKVMEERAIWEILAERDPEAKKLLEQLDELKSGKLML